MRHLFRARSGFLLVESVVGFAVFGMFLTAVGMSFVASYQSRAGAGDRVRGVTLTEAAIEGTKSVRDGSFAAVTTGAHGVRIGSGALGARWIFDGTKVTSKDGYSTTVTVSTLSSDWLQLQARTTWNRGLVQSGSVTLTTEVTDWRTAKATGNWASPTEEGSYVDGGTPLFNSVVRSGNYAFVSSMISGGGKGLYVFDISNPASPNRVASSFDLGAAGYDMVINGSTLYVATSAGSTEVQAFNIASPTGLSMSDRTATYDLPGSGRARSLTLNGTVLLVGATEDAAEDEVYSFDVSSSAAITLEDSTNVDGTVNDLALRKQRYTYVASSEDVAELRVGDINNPAAMQLPSGSGYNLTDVQDALAAAATGTSAIVGRTSGSAIEELVLFDLEAGAAPTPPPGPWYYEVGGTVNALSIAPGGQFAFLACAIGGKHLDIVNLRKLQWGQAAQVGAMTVSSGLGRGILYDPWKDRVYLVTDKGFHIIKPS